MGIQVFWLFVSYALLFAIGAAIWESGNVVAALLVMACIPAARMAMRFRAKGGYRMIGRGALATGPKQLTRTDTPSLFKIFVFLELSVLVFFAVGLVLR